MPKRLNPLVPREKLEANRRQLDPVTFRREYEAQFVGDEDRYFQADLIDRADHSAIVILQKTHDRTLRLVYVKEFPLGTPYASVTGWIRRLNTRFHFSSATLDETGVGAGPVEGVKAFLPRAEGVVLSAKRKLEILSSLLVLMQQGRIAIPFEQELITHISSQRHELGKSGHTLFSHPGRSHDDRLWALALAARGAATAIVRPSFEPVTRSF